jgi:hypothetical protein
VSGIYHHRPLIPLSGVGTTCFLLPFSSVTGPLHAHFFHFHVIFHTIYPSYPKPTSTREPIDIHSHHSFCYMTFIPPHNAHTNLTYCFSFFQTLSNFPLYSFLILFILVTPHINLNMSCIYVSMNKQNENLTRNAVVFHRNDISGSGQDVLFKTSIMPF